MAEPVYGAEVYQSQIQPPVAIESLRPAEMVVEEGPVIENWFQDRTSSLWATLGSDFDGITAGGAGFKFQAPRGLGLEGSVMTLRESGTNFRDNLWLGDLNLVGEIVNRPNVRGRIGIGFNWLADSWGSEAGLNLTAGADLKLTERLMVSLESDIGTLGDADFFHARINASRRFDSLEWITGVDHFNIGGAEINSVFTGIQLRF